MKFALIATLFALGADEKIEFNRDVRPILTEFCFSCHGVDGASRKAGLRLDQRENALKQGAIVPHKAGESELIARIFSNEKSEVMPPPATLKKLTGQQKATLKRWVEEGAEYQPHWAYIVPTRPALPAVKNQAWVRNPIDAFILAKLEAKNLTPAPEADRRTLARRLSLDITGLPPTIDTVEAFVSDPAPDAYDRTLKKLFQSPHYGEHRARYWLDAARYADTHGLHFDNYREMWPYRDWVINAFNQNQPFDQFTVDQIAGDLLPNATLDQKIGSGFHRCNITTNEGGTIAEENLAIYAKDRVETTATVWLGLTAGCASCHDHKYDPLTQKEFYQFAAFFRNTTQGAMDGNIRDTPPVVVVPNPQDRDRWNELTAQTISLRKKIEERRKAIDGAFAAWLKEGKAKGLAEPLDPKLEAVRLELTEGKDKASIVAAGKPTDMELPKGVSWHKGSTPDHKGLIFKENVALSIPGSGGFDPKKPFTLTGWFLIPGNAKVIASQLDKDQGWKLEKKGNLLSFTIQAGKTQLVVNPKDFRFTTGKWAHFAVVYDGSESPAGLTVYAGGKTYFAEPGPNLQGATLPNASLQIGPDLKDGAIFDVRLFREDLSQDEITVLAKWSGLRGELAKNPTNPQGHARTDLSLLYAVRFDAGYRKLALSLERPEREMQDIRLRSPVTHVMQERGDSMPKAQVLFRGQYDQPKETVAPDVFATLHDFPKDAPRNRLGLAQWLIAADNPLTARVIVNRFWQEVFGTGLVRTSGDLGISGELPSHPELLDWLAVEFRESGWDVRKLFTLMLTSNTYRQASVATAEKLAKDPANALLSRGPRFRMDAEMIRDYALAVSGTLSSKIGGASVKPYQPDGVWEAVAMIGSNTRDYKRDSGDALYRRTMYTFWKRAAPPAALDVLNAPSREYCTVRRERTNTPLQALVTLNDPQYVEAARNLAQIVLKETQDDVGRMDFLARRILARPFRAEERKVVADSLAGLAKYYRANEAEAQKLVAVGESRSDATLSAAQLAAWTMLCNELLNLDEVLNK